MFILRDIMYTLYLAKSPKNLNLEKKQSHLDMVQNVAEKLLQ